jgi:hypothetical protein
MSDLAQTLSMAGLVATSFGTLVTAVLGLWNIVLSRHQMTAMTEATREVKNELMDIGNTAQGLVTSTENIAKTVDTLAKATLDSIKESAAATSQAIREDLAATRQSITEDVAATRHVALEAIEKDGATTRQAIEKDGATTRQAIVEAHKSILDLRR